MAGKMIARPIVIGRGIVGTRCVSIAFATHAL